MLRYLLHRLLISIPVLIGISLIVFFLIKLQPGDPLAGMISPETTPQQKEEMMRAAGYLDPLWQQYGRWAGQVLQGDLGHSTQNGVAVLTLIAERLSNTFLLAGGSLLIALLVAWPLGVWIGLRRGGKTDRLVALYYFISVSIPVFFTAILLVKLFAMQLRWLPVSGATTLGVTLAGTDHLLDVLRHLLLPASALAVANIAIFSRYLRAGIDDIIRQPFVRALFARGLPLRRVIFPHLIKNTARPLITLFCLELPALLSSTLLTEIIFNWPGVGRLSFDAIQARDYPLLMGIVLFLALVTLLINLLADLLYAAIDPRVRLTS